MWVVVVHQQLPIFTSDLRSVRGLRRMRAAHGAGAHARRRRDVRAVFCGARRFAYDPVSGAVLREDANFIGAYMTLEVLSAAELALANVLKRWFQHDRQRRGPPPLPRALAFDVVRFVRQAVHGCVYHAGFKVFAAVHVRGQLAQPVTSIGDVLREKARYFHELPKSCEAYNARQ